MAGFNRLMLLHTNSELWKSRLIRRAAVVWMPRSISLNEAFLRGYSSVDGGCFNKDFS